MGQAREVGAQAGTAAGPRLTAIILTLNEANHIEACIHSLSWADDVLVFDSFSSDDTVALAEGAGGRVLQSRFQNYAQQRNAALQAVQTDWVFFIDADERGTPELGAEIRDVINEAPQAAWYVPRHNYIFGELTLGAGWYPDYQLRLLRHGFVTYERPVHETGVVDGEIGYLQQPLIHHNYVDRAQFHAKQAGYSSYDAGILHQQGVHPRPQNYVLQPWRQFWWRYVTLKGYQDGLHGLRLSLYMGYYEWVKYRKLAAMWRGSEPGEPLLPGQGTRQ